MADILVLDWLDEFESLTESEIHMYSIEQEHNHEVMMALYSVLSEPQKFKSDNLIDGICQQLLNFYRSGEINLRRFTIQFIPILVFLHLSDKSYSAVQTLLVSLYNLEVIDSKGQPRTLSFRIPSIAQSSIFHDSSNLEPAFIAENSLRRWEECNTKLVSWGPLPQVECLNAQNRQRVATALIFLYNQQLANVMEQGVEQTCRGISRLVMQGFNSTLGSNRSSVASDSSIQQTVRPRVPVSSPLLIELLHIIYHAAVRCGGVAVQALHDIMYRARYETFAEVLLAANSVKNLLQNSPTVSAAPRPSHSHSISKSMITNASFRTKKLPDDIPIQDLNQPLQSEATLDSITEEQEDVEKAKTKGSSGALKHLPKIPGIGKKHKVKNSSQLGESQQIELTGSGDTLNESLVNDVNHSVHVSAV
ncbi:PI4KA lipid kinase complex subunit hyccin isoform X1 [Leptinotarsa decemlineata]|uniref:PI4KA lipid kinase complex subunit hyccin isoform X1 n=1 Tax=Leptinotarsa decemlineata TaxID=7539 RepID=UPI003D3075F6